MKKVCVGGTNALRSYTLVDDDNYHEIIKHKWHDNGCGYLLAWINGKHIPIHRLILGSQTKHKMIDHINHDTYDNTKENLRLVTAKENCNNKKEVALPSGYYSLNETMKILNYKNVISLLHWEKAGVIKKYKFGKTPCYEKIEIDRLSKPPNGYVSKQDFFQIYYKYGLNVEYSIRKNLIRIKKQLGKKYYNLYDINATLKPDLVSR